VTKQEKGRLIAIVGCMFAGKTEELFRRLVRERYANRECIVFKHQKDVRCPADRIETHDGRTCSAKSAGAAENILNAVLCLDVIGERPIDVVAIDEVQFFEPEILDAIEILLCSGRDVIATGLTTDFRGKPYKHVPALMAVADEICVLTAICMKCGKEANRSQLLAAPPEAGQDKVGGKGMYEARCRDCHEPPA
jgi:thymidine kinase